MTAIRRLTLTCDHGLCPVRLRSLVDDEPIRELRKQARAMGWIYLPGHPAVGIGRDLCPRHRHTP